MAGNGLPKKFLVFELYAGHIEKIFDAVLHIELSCIGSSNLVFNGVLAFQPPGEIHRHEPARDMAGQSERAADRPKDLLPCFPWRGVELFKPFADTPPVVPFLGLYLFYTFFFGRISKTLPMPAISVGRRNLAGIGVLEYPDKIFAGGSQFD